MSHESIETCEVQLFRETTDTDEAVDSIYYREDYDYPTDDKFESESNLLAEKIIDFNLMKDNTELMNDCKKCPRNYD